MEYSERAEKVADNIARLTGEEKKEPIARFLGMRLVEMTPGYARVVMKVRPEYLNFHGMVFGGIIMAVADQAFAYAANSVAYPSVASQFNLHFLAGAGAGDELIAECRVIKSGKRVGVSEITVTNQEGRLIARSTATTIPLGARKGEE